MSVLKRNHLNGTFKTWPQFLFHAKVSRGSICLEVLFFLPSSKGMAAAERTRATARVNESSPGRVKRIKKKKKKNLRQTEEKGGREAS